jgi:hypothetical protein
MSPFLICSTPRSGSAWLANFLTYDGCFCAHEPMAGGFGTITGYKVVGSVDTAAAWMVEEIRRTMPDLRIYHLARDFYEVHESLRRMGIDGEIPPIGDGWKYESLFTIPTLRELWGEIVGTTFDETRARMLIEMNVQRDLRALRHRLGEG